MSYKKIVVLVLLISVGRDPVDRGFTTSYYKSSHVRSIGFLEFLTLRLVTHRSMEPCCLYLKTKTLFLQLV